MIRNRDHQTLFMNFDNIQVYQGRPSDIDMFYIDKKFMIIGEIKNELGSYSDSQKLLHTNLAKIINIPVYILYLTHKEKAEDGATEVDVSKCQVKEYYYNGSWHLPKKPITCQEAFDIICQRYF